MIHSMTAFARCERQGEWGTAAWELRSVNHRYLEAGVRMPESVRDLEGVVRERLRTALKRGEAAAAGVSLDVELARQVVHASREVDSLLYNPAPVSSMDVLRWPGVIRTEQADPETLKAALLELLDEAIIELLEARAREGAQLRGFIEERLAAVGAEVERVRTRVPEVLAAQRERLLARLEEVRAELDPARLEQEMVLLAQKMDVTEEMDRLGAHVKEVGRVLKQGGAVGRRLDFLMQELNREANTLGSKSQDAETTRSSVELKVLIEQMREQVQNIE
jgi:uncharacterized protein (TIGR00255 family)